MPRGSALPPNAVVIGDAAPGICMDTGLMAIPVISGLANDDDPLGRYAGLPRCVVILEGRRNSGWWRSRYPAVVRPERRIRSFESIGGQEVGVYSVQADAGGLGGHASGRSR